MSGRLEAKSGLDVVSESMWTGWKWEGAWDDADL